MNYSQNFLVDKDVIRKISDNISTERPLIEIGCGKGNLSEVVSPDLCIEIDQRLLSFLKNYNPIQGDARKLPVLRGQIISSLPYSITYDFFMEIIKINGISRLLLILQEDFVNKVIDYPTFISFILNYYFEINKLFVIPPSSFRPAPRIFSALVSLKRSRQYDQKVTDVIACISKYRNKSLNNIAKLCGLNSSSDKRLRDFKPWMVIDILATLGISYA